MLFVKKLFRSQISHHPECKYIVYSSTPLFLCRVCTLTFFKTMNKHMRLAFKIAAYGRRVVRYGAIVQIYNYFRRLMYFDLIHCPELVLK